MRNIEKTSVFTKDFKSLPNDVQDKTWDVVNILKCDIFDDILKIKKLEGYKNVWRLSIKKDYRLIYSFDKENIYLLRIRHRKDIYKRLEL